MNTCVQEIWEWTCVLQRSSGTGSLISTRGFTVCTHLVHYAQHYPMESMVSPAFTTTRYSTGTEKMHRTQLQSKNKNQKTGNTPEELISSIIIPDLNTTVATCVGFITNNIHVVKSSVLRSLFSYKDQYFPNKLCILNTSKLLTYISVCV